MFSLFKTKNRIGSDIFEIKKFGFLTPTIQIVSISLFFVINLLWNYSNYQHTHSLFGYPLAVSVFFAPIYEEILFRGFILIGLAKIYSLRNSAIITCLLFGLWHLKNIFWLSPIQLIYQMIYAAFIIGPIFIFLTLKTKSIWPGVMLHYANNILALATYGFTMQLLISISRIWTK